MDYKHLYVAFWRPDLLAELQRTNGPGLAVCDYQGPTSAMVANFQDTTCPACRETFLNACLPTGNGVKLTWFQHVADEQQRDRVRRDAEAAKAGAWATAPLPIPEATGWTTPAKDDGWR